MDAGTHLFVGVVAATANPALSLEQKLFVIFFALLPDSFEWLDYLKMREISSRPNGKVEKKDFVKLGIKIQESVFMMPYHILHSLLAATLFLIATLFFGWTPVYSMMWFGHILLDLPSHQHALGIRLFYPFSKWRIKGLFDWWSVPILKDNNILAYWGILLAFSLYLVQKFW